MSQMIYVLTFLDARQILPLLLPFHWQQSQYCLQYLILYEFVQHKNLPSFQTLTIFLYQAVFSLLICLEIYIVIRYIDSNTNIPVLGSIGQWYCLLSVVASVLVAEQNISGGEIWNVVALQNVHVANAAILVVVAQTAHWCYLHLFSFIWQQC